MTIDDPDALLAWLDAHVDQIVRLPVYVTLTSNKMNVETGTVGALAIFVQDNTLAVPLAGKLGLYFGDGASEGRVWLQGFWRGGAKRMLQVTRVEGAASDSENTATLLASAT